MSASDLTAASAAKSLCASPAGLAAGTAEAVSWRTPLELTLLGAIWGASFMFMRVAAGDFGPFPLVEMRRMPAAPRPAGTARNRLQQPA